MNDFQTIRDEFPLFANKIHLDVAFKCPLSNRLVQAMTGFLVDYQMTGGNKQSWLGMVERARSIFSRMINVKPEDISFIKNTSEGLNTIAWGIGLTPGDNIILNDLEHTNNVQPWLNHQRFGVEVRWVRNQNGRILPDAVKERMDGRTRVVSLSSVQYKNGFRSDLQGIGELCRKSDILFVVDAIQHLGVLSLDAKRLNIDVLCCGGHKFLLGPHGIGVMYVSESCVNRIIPTFAGINSKNQVVESRQELSGKKICFGGDTRKFEYGYMNFVGIAGLMASAEMLMETGANTIEQHALRLNHALVNRLQQHGAHLISPLGDHERSAILTVKLKDPQHFESIMLKNNVIATVREGTLRISFHYYNTIGDFDPLIECLMLANEIDR